MTVKKIFLKQKRFHLCLGQVEGGGYVSSSYDVRGADDLRHGASDVASVVEVKS